VFTIVQILGQLSKVLNKVGQTINNKLFFGDANILNPEKFYVSTAKLTKEQQKWFQDNKQAIFYCFKTIRQDKTTIKKQIDLVKLLDKMNNNFFGGLLTFGLINNKSK
jgi:hypothetical protein